VSQIDLPKGQLSGLVEAEHVLKRVKGIAHTRFTTEDVVRHPLVARIVDAYDKSPSHRDDAHEAIDLVATPVHKTSARSRNGS
jgi:phosphate starvation-inducible PhoH-like protein